MYEKRKSGVQASLDFLFYARRTSNSHHKRYSYSLLGPGTLTAHRRFHLVLLHSCPDTVHRFPLRKTQTSTPLTQGSSATCCPRQGITPAGADCRFRAPLSPRLRGNFMTNLCLSSIPVRPAFVKAHLYFIFSSVIIPSLTVV